LGVGYGVVVVAVVVAVDDAASGGTIEGLASMRMVLVLVDVRPDCLVAT
jgi:hypothetical protein